jgi:hypothetical protein
MEEFIFDDDVDEVGAEVEAHCPKCKADTTHVVVSKYEDEIRRVQCNPCGDVHTFRKPRGEEEGEPEPVVVSKKKQKAKPTYEQVMAKQKNKPPRPYAIGEYFKEPEVLSHPKFGVGYVTENIGDDKIEVTFATDKRVLIHNRKNLTLPFLRPLNPPKGEKKGKAAAAAPAPAPAPKEAAKPAKAAASAAARPAAKKPAAKAAAARPAAKPAAKAKAKPVAKKAARAAAKKPVKPKAVKKIKKSR